MLACLVITQGGTHERDGLRGRMFSVPEAMLASEACEFTVGVGPVRDVVLRSEADGVESGELDADAAFAGGYLDGGGDVRYLRHLLEDVRPCEGEWYVEYLGPHVSAFQFDRGTWQTASSATGYTDTLDPYHVGVNVAWLLNELTRRGVSPGSTAGWPTCWHRGLVP